MSRWRDGWRRRSCRLNWAAAGTGRPSIGDLQMFLAGYVLVRAELGQDVSGAGAGGLREGRLWERDDGAASATAKLSSSKTMLRTSLRTCSIAVSRQAIWRSGASRAIANSRAKFNVEGWLVADDRCGFLSGAALCWAGAGALKCQCWRGTGESRGWFGYERSLQNLLRRLLPESSF